MVQMHHSLDGAATLGDYTRRIGTHQHFLFLRRLVKSVLVLNLLDGILTLVWIYTGAAEEANPLMAPLVMDQPILFMAAKTSLVALGSWMLWHHRKRPAAVVGIFVGFMTYYMLLLYHLSAMDLQLLSRAFAWVTS